MVLKVIEAFYVGTFAQMDTNESNWTTENTGIVTGGTFGSPADPLYNRIINLTLNDANNDGAIKEDDMGRVAEQIIYQGTGSNLDATLRYNVTLTYRDGTTANTQMMVLQDVSGRVFLAPRGAGSADNAVLDDQGIRSITLNSVAADGFDGVFTTLEPNAFVICFVQGTRIATDRGEVPVERLRAGDLVLTADHGMQPIRWIRGREVQARGKLAPICIAPGALGRGRPLRELRVSPQHRLLLRSKIAERLTGCREVLIAAFRLLGLPGLSRAAEGGHVTYWHFLFDRHEIVFAEGTEAESLHPGRQVLKLIDREGLRELFALFPDLARPETARPLSRPVVEAAQAAQFLRRLIKNAQPANGQ